jgi:transposase-like protein
LSKDGKPLYVRAAVLNNVTGEAVLKFTEKFIDKDTIIKSDGLSVYNILDKNGYNHQSIKFDQNKNPEHLHWLHIIVSNAKAFISGTCHGLTDTHLQAYLDEFCFRFNSRFRQNQIFASTKIGRAHV